MIYQYPNKFTFDDCQVMIEAALPTFVKAEVLGEKIDGYRKADSTWLPIHNPISKKVFHTIHELTNCKPEQMELIQIVKYGIGGEYKPHHDFFHITEDYAAEHIANGGNRIKTALIYLNDDFEGGETEFPKLNTIIAPELGKLVIWDNMVDDKLDYTSIHAGLPVKSGVKYIAVVFIRENNFGNQN